MHSKRRPARGAISKAKIWWKKIACLQMWVQMWRQVKMWRQNNAAPKCGFRHKCGGTSEMMEMWRQAQMWWRLRKWPKCGVKQCGVRHKCGGSPKCGVKQCGVKMCCQAQMWWQSEMWRQTMWRQNVASDTPFAKLSSRKCVFKKGIQWQAQKCYTKCLCPVELDY